MRPRRGTPALPLLLLGLPAASSAQYVEGAPRRPGVPVPDEVARMQAEAAPALGIRTVGALVRDAREGRSDARTGTLPLLVIPALFSDSPEPHVPASEIRRVLQEGPREGGTLADYFLEQSGGALEVRTTVAEWVRTSVSLRGAAGMRDGHGFVGDDIGRYIIDALELADERVDYGEFDNDGPDGVPNSADDDGVVDAVAIEFLEVAGSCGGPGIWPHLSTARRGTPDFEPFETDDPRSEGGRVVVDPYMTESATDCSGESVQGIEVTAHELGHGLGLPDYYRPVTGPGPDQRHWNLGCFALMSAGGWGCGTGIHATGFGPTGMSPLSRMSLGWIEPRRVERATDREFVLEPVQTSGDVLVVSLAPGSPEAFQIEYRPRIGFDEPLPAGGVLVYHHDAYEGERPRLEGEPIPYRYHLVEADGDHALRRLEPEGGNRGVAGDVFGLAGSREVLDEGTVPSTRGHAGKPSTLRVHSIRVDGDVARVRLSTGSDLVLADGTLSETALVLDSVGGGWSVQGGVPPYTARTDPAGALPPELEVSMDGDRVVMRGRAWQAGTFPVSVVVADAEGGQVYELVELEVEDPSMGSDVLVALMVETRGDTAADELRRYLDLSGNGDGAYDVGDLRARVQRLFGPPP